MSPVLASSGEYGYVAVSIRFGVNQGSSEAEKPIVSAPDFCIRWGVLHQSQAGGNRPSFAPKDD